MLHTQHGQSLVATIELSLSSQMFQELGPDARGLLGVVAFFPQGVNENNVDWLFPTLSDRTRILDTFCILSLTYRSDGFIRMLTPLRDHFFPEDPGSSPLLCTTKDHYFARFLVFLNPGAPGFEDARWITSEDVNVEHLLDVFTSIDANSVDVWDTCASFMRHLLWHKPRLVGLGRKIGGLPDDHCSKPTCLFELSWLFHSVGNHAEHKRLLIQALELWRGRGDEFQVANTLRFMSESNRLLGLYKEGIVQAKEALEFCERLNDISGQATSWQLLAWLLYYDKQLDAAEEAALRASDLSNKGDQYPVCDCHRILGSICHSRGETEKAINHFETALRIASSFKSRHHLFWINFSLAMLFFDEKRFDDAHVHVERVKSHTINSPYYLGRAMELQAILWCKERKLEEAKCEALGAIDVFERLGAAKDLKRCRATLRNIEKETERPVTSGELSETVPLPTSVNSPFSARGTTRHHPTNLFQGILPQKTDPTSGQRTKGKRG